MGEPAGHGEIQRDNLADRPSRRASPWLPALVPVTAVLILCFALPLGNLAATSLHPNLGLGQVGAEFTIGNYRDFLTDPFYLRVMGETLWLGVVVVVACMVLGYPVAYFLARTRSRWRNLMIFMVVAPLLISLVIRNVGWFPVLGESGLVNWALRGLGLIHEPLRLTNNFTGIAIGLVHTQLPFMIISLTTVIQRIEPEIEEAALNLGAGPIRTFWHVVLPLSRPGLRAGFLLVFTMVIAAYTTPAMLGGQRVLVMATYIAQQVLTVLNYPLGATAAVVLMLVASGIGLVSLRDGARER